MKTLIIFLLVLKLIESKINVEIEAGVTPKVSVTGVNTKIASDSDIKLFFKNPNLRQAVTSHYGRKPTTVYFKSPTPWGDLYKTQKWSQVTAITTFDTYKIKSSNKNPTAIFTEDFVNNSNNTIKVNAGVSHSFENTLTTTWSKSQEFEISQEVEYNLNIIVAKIEGNTGFSFTTTWGKSEEKSQSETIGSTSSVEIELQPGKAVTAVLSVNSGVLEVEIHYKTSLRGNLAVNYRKSLNGHHFWGPLVKDVMKSAGVENSVGIVEVIKVGYNIDAKLQVFDKLSGDLVN